MSNATRSEVPEASNPPADLTSESTSSHGPAPDHTIGLPGGRWRLWRQFVLRSAGFPARRALDLSVDGLAAAADRHTQRMGEVERCRQVALRELTPASATSDLEAQRMLRRRRRELSRRVVNAAEARTPSEAALAAATEAEASASAEYIEAYERAAVELADRAVTVASDPRFREAVLWQNHRAMRLVSRKLTEGRGKDRRQAVDFVALQLQRYAVKNDSIGFFGPIGWAALADRPLAIDLRPGPTLIGRREVYFEGWSIDALVDRFNEDVTVRSLSAPRLASGVWLDTEGAHVPGEGLVTIAPEQRRILELCDGHRTAAEIAALLSIAARDAASLSAVLAALCRLEDLQLIVWKLEVACQLYPERDLQRRLDAIGDPSVQARCHVALAELVDARDHVARAAGDPDSLAAALSHLDEVFVRLTGREPTRRAGSVYAGRGLVYEDTLRDCQLTLGREFLDRLGPPLSLVLDAVRWTATEITEFARRQLRRICQDLCRAAGTDTIDAHQFYCAVVRTAPARISGAATDVRARVRSKWQSILEIDDRAHRLTRTVDEVADRARDAFRTWGPTWTRGRYTCPDVMVAARSVEAFRRGEFQCVLGEVHPMNTLVWSMFVSQHPAPESLVAATAHDQGGVPAVANQEQKDAWLARLAVAVHAPTVWMYEWGDVPPAIGRRTAPAGRFVAVDDGRGVRIRARDSALEFDGIDLVSRYLAVLTISVLKDWLPDLSHTPRISIGDLTVARERWWLRPREMPFLQAADRASQFAALRAWAREHRMPQRVFYKSPAEPKPCFLDFNSPLFSRIFVKLMRQLGADVRVRIEEMYPDIEQTWLVDAEGRCYTAELRLAALLPDASPAS